MLRRLRDDVAQIGGGGVGVGELQQVCVDGLYGAVLQAEAGIVVEGGWDAVAMLDGEVERAAAGRFSICDCETAKTKLNLSINRSDFCMSFHFILALPYTCPLGGSVIFCKP